MLDKFKKTVMGMEVKPRSKEEIDKDYTIHLIELSKKMRIIHHLQEEVAQHVKKLNKLSVEGEARQNLDKPKEHALTQDEEHA